MHCMTAVLIRPWTLIWLYMLVVKQLEMASFTATPEYHPSVKVYSEQTPFLYDRRKESA